MREIYRARFIGQIKIKISKIEPSLGVERIWLIALDVLQCKLVCYNITIMNICKSLFYGDFSIASMMLNYIISQSYD